MNKVMLLGNVGREPQEKTTKTGVKIAEFSLATSKKNKTTWHNIICFNKTAELVMKHVFKGKQLFIEGELDIDNYEKDGVKKTFVKVIANNITFVGSKKEEKDPLETFNNPKVDTNDMFATDDIPF